MLYADMKGRLDKFGIVLALMIISGNKLEACSYYKEVHTEFLYCVFIEFFFF